MYTSRDKDTDVYDIISKGMEHSGDSYEQFKWFNDKNLSNKQSVTGMIQWVANYFRSSSTTKIELTYNDIDLLMRGFYFAINYMQKDIPDHMYNYIYLKTYNVLNDMVQQKYDNEQ